ncbi:hypothetical protein ACFL0V_00215 [Nanoarchaeota archaeon]
MHARPIRNTGAEIESFRSRLKANRIERENLVKGVEEVDKHTKHEYHGLLKKAMHIQKEFAHSMDGFYHHFLDDRNFSESVEKAGRVLKTVAGHLKHQTTIVLSGFIGVDRLREELKKEDDTIQKIGRIMWHYTPSFHSLHRHEERRSFLHSLKVTGLQLALLLGMIMILIAFFKSTGFLGSW